MEGSFWQALAGCAGFAALHSALLTDRARGWAQAALGAEAFRRWYRLAYCAVSAATLAALLWWLARLPDAEWARLRGGWAVLLWAARLSGMAVIGWAASQFGLRAFLGFDALWGRWGTDPGDGLDLGPIRATGPYAYVRHPMYAAGLLVLWGEPRWTANRAAVIFLFSAYLLLGALWEERRLTRLHGEAYRRYAAATPRFVPRLWERDRKSHWN